MTGPLLSLLQRQLSFHYLKVVSRNHATELYDVKQTPLFKLVTTCLTDLRSFDGLSFSLTWESMLVSSCYKIDTFGDNSNNNNNNNNKSCSIMMYLITFSFHLVLLGLWNKGGRNGRCMKHALMRKLYNFIQKMWRGGHLRDVGVGVRIIIKWIKIYRMWGCVGLVKLVRRWDHWRPLWTFGSIKCGKFLDQLSLLLAYLMETVIHGVTDIPVQIKTSVTVLAWSDHAPSHLNNMSPHSTLFSLCLC